MKALKTALIPSMLALIATVASAQQAPGTSAAPAATATASTQTAQPAGHKNPAVEKSTKAAASTPAPIGSAPAHATGQHAAGVPVKATPATAATPATPSTTAPTPAAAVKPAPTKTPG